MGTGTSFTRSSRTIPAAVAAEVEAQLSRFEELLGRAPTHLDSHQHVHRGDPVRSVVPFGGCACGIPVRDCTSEIAYRDPYTARLETANRSRKRSRWSRCSPCEGCPGGDRPGVNCRGADLSASWGRHVPFPRGQSRNTALPGRPVAPLESQPGPRTLRCPRGTVARIADVTNP